MPIINGSPRVQKASLRHSVIIRTSAFTRGMVGNLPRSLSLRCGRFLMAPFLEDDHLHCVSLSVKVLYAPPFISENQIPIDVWCNGRTSFHKNGKTSYPRHPHIEDLLAMSGWRLIAIRCHLVFVCFNP